MGAAIAIELLGPGDEAVLGEVAPGVFDDPVRPIWAREFLEDPRHHLAVALDAGRVVGMASAFHYVHPDDPAQLFINEVGVSPGHQRRGVGRRLVQALLARGRELGCREAWVATEEGNVAARGLYASTGGIPDPERVIVYGYRLDAGR